jgi:hypothetical protein
MSVSSDPARAAALAAGEKQYDPGIPCRQGHRLRYAANGKCVLCMFTQGTGKPASEYRPRAVMTAATKAKRAAAKAKRQARLAERAAIKAERAAMAALPKELSPYRLAQIAKAAKKAAAPLSQYQLDCLARRERIAANTKHKRKLIAENEATPDEPTQTEMLVKANAEYLRRLTLEKLQAIRAAGEIAI